MSDYYFYEPSEGHPFEHDPFNSIIAPRPIGWISTQSKEGVANIAPYSFFNAFNYKPPIIGFSSIGRKDSVFNAEATGQFCWNLVDSALAEAMNMTSSTVQENIDEFELANLEKAHGQRVDVPFVKAAFVAMECKTTQIVQLKGANGALNDTFLVLGTTNSGRGQKVPRHHTVQGQDCG